MPAAARSCNKGNACDGCDHFATDCSYLPEIRRQLAGTEQLIEHRKSRHLARYWGTHERGQHPAGAPLGRGPEHAPGNRRPASPAGRYQHHPWQWGLRRSGYQGEPAPRRHHSQAGRVMKRQPPKRLTAHGGGSDRRPAQSQIRCAVWPRPNARPPPPAPGRRSVSSSRASGRSTSSGPLSQRRTRTRTRTPGDGCLAHAPSAWTDFWSAANGISSAFSPSTSSTTTTSGRIAAAALDRRARALWVLHYLRQLSASVAGTGSAG
jgi:hypothetical protein